MERRRSRRVSLMADITYEADGAAITKRIADISEGGVFIDTPVPSEVGVKLKVSFTLEGQEVEAAGRVVYSQPYIGMGIEFTQIAEDSVDHINQFVGKNATAEVACV